MENVLSTLTLNNVSSIPVQEQKNAKWNLIELKNKYDAGAMMAGMGDGEGSIHDFILKLINVLASIAKSRQKTIDQKIIDLIKTSMLIYLDSLNVKKDNVKDNAGIVSTIQGFVNQFVENGKYEDRI